MAVSGAIAHTRLESVSDAVAKVLSGPIPVRMMAARGMSPLPPRDLVTAIYCLSLDEDPAIAQAASEIPAKLPDRVLVGPLAEALDPRILDFFAVRLATRRPLVDALVQNRAIAVESIAAVTRLANDPALIDLIAENEQRLLAWPAIIAAMYMNPKARMSTVSRACELAARNDVRVDVPHWEDVVADVARAPKSAPSQLLELDHSFQKATELAVEDDAAVAKRVEAAAEAARDLVPDEIPPDLIDGAEATGEAGADENRKRIQDLPVGAKMRLAMLGNAFARSILVRDTNRVVALAAVRSPRIKESEIISFAGNRSLSDDVIRYISGAKEWLRLTQVKTNLVFNPKTPLQIAMRLLPHLPAKQMKVLSRSRNISSALSSQAKKLISAKTPGG